MKKLYKSNNRMICGVCAGVAEYFGIDPTIVRLIWAALALSGTGILLYIVAAIVMPENQNAVTTTASRTPWITPITSPMNAASAAFIPKAIIVSDTATINSRLSERIPVK